MVVSLLVMSALHDSAAGGLLLGVYWRDGHSINSPLPHLDFWTTTGQHSTS